VFAGAHAHNAVAIMRAAHQYTDALWWADLDPRVAWIKLFGALEAGADRWDASTQPDPVASTPSATSLACLPGRMPQLPPVQPILLVCPVARFAEVVEMHQQGPKLLMSRGRSPVRRQPGPESLVFQHHRSIVPVVRAPLCGRRRVEAAVWSERFEQGLPEGFDRLISRVRVHRANFPPPTRSM
jgi:hypothetical protein